MLPQPLQHFLGTLPLVNILEVKTVLEILVIFENRAFVGFAGVWGSLSVLFRANSRMFIDRKSSDCEAWGISLGYFEQLLPKYIYYQFCM